MFLSALWDLRHLFLHAYYLHSVHGLSSEFCLASLLSVFYTGRWPNLANAQVSTVDRDISERNFF